MSTPEKPDGPDEFMDLDAITEQQMLKALREMKPHKPSAKEPGEPMQLDDIAEDGLLKMLRARKLHQPHSTWSFSIWERRPAIWAPGFAFSLKDGVWVPVNSSEVGMEARSSTREAVEAEFGALPETPPFPLKEIEAALVDRIGK